MENLAEQDPRTAQVPSPAQGIWLWPLLAWFPQHSRKTRQGLIGPYSQAKKRTRIFSCLLACAFTARPGAWGSPAGLRRKSGECWFPHSLFPPSAWVPSAGGLLPYSWAQALLQAVLATVEITNAGEQNIQVYLAGRMVKDLKVVSSTIRPRRPPTSSSRYCPAEPASPLALCLCQKLFSRKEPVNTLILKS